MDEVVSKIVPNTSQLNRKTHFALFVVEALENDKLVHEARRLSAVRRPRRSRPVVD
jgi:hypothetical protein